MQNYQNTPRVSTVQNQSRIQSLTFSQLSQPKTVQKIRKVNKTSTITNQSKNPTMDSNQYSKTSNQSHKPTNSKNQSITNNQSINIIKATPRTNRKLVTTNKSVKISKPNSILWQLWAQEGGEELERSLFTSAGSRDSRIQGGCKLNQDSVLNLKRKIKKRWRKKESS